MATSTKNNRVQQLAGEQKLIDGTKQFLSQLGSLPVGSQTVTPAEIVQVFEDRIAKGESAVAASNARTAAVKADRDERLKTAPFVNAFKRIVIGMFLQSPDTLGAFGLHPPKVTKKTAVIKATATQKMAATKKARGPIGKKQRAKVKAPAPAAGTSPATSAAATAASPAPTASTAAAPAPSPAPSGGGTATAPAARPGA
jgi:hypothetical protein